MVVPILHCFYVHSSCNLVGLLLPPMHETGGEGGGGVGDGGGGVLFSTLALNIGYLLWLILNPLVTVFHSSCFICAFYIWLIYTSMYNTVLSFLFLLQFHSVLSSWCWYFLNVLQNFLWNIFNSSWFATSSSRLWFCSKSSLKFLLNLW